MSISTQQLLELVLSNSGGGGADSGAEVEEHMFVGSITGTPDAPAYSAKGEAFQTVLVRGQIEGEGPVKTRKLTLWRDVAEAGLADLRTSKEAGSKPVRLAFFVEPQQKAGRLYRNVNTMPDRM